MPTMRSALFQAGLALVGFAVILEGLGLAVLPQWFAYIAGPGARDPKNRGWTRLQGAGLMLLGAGFVTAGVDQNSSQSLPAVIGLAFAACVMFSLSVVRRGQT